MPPSTVTTNSEHGMVAGGNRSEVCFSALVLKANDIFVMSLRRNVSVRPNTTSYDRNEGGVKSRC